jgi:hypothetical protein
VPSNDFSLRTCLPAVLANNKRIIFLVAPKLLNDQAAGETAPAGGEKFLAILPGWC